MHENIERLKADNQMLTKEMEVQHETDKEIRKQLQVKHSVNRIKRDNFRQMSDSKYKLVERNINERYEFNGL